MSFFLREVLIAGNVSINSPDQTVRKLSHTDRKTVISTTTSKENSERDGIIIEFQLQQYGGQGKYHNLSFDWMASNPERGYAFSCPGMAY